MNELTGRVAIVTGGGGGFGRAIAVGLAQAGAAVVVTARRQANLDDSARLIREEGGRALAVAGDVTNRSDVELVVDTARRQLGPVTIFVHSAGVPWPFGPIWALDPERWWEAAAVHVKGAVLFLHEVMPDMIERKLGHILLVSSLAGARVRPSLSGYGVPKNTQVRLAQFVAAEGKPHGIQAFSIHPGDVLTELSDLAMADPDAQQYLPEFVGRLKGRKETGDIDEPGLDQCARLCVAIAAGQYDDLSGSYLMPDGTVGVIE